LDLTEAQRGTYRAEIRAIDPSGYAIYMMASITGIHSEELIPFPGFLCPLKRLQIMTSVTARLYVFSCQDFACLHADPAVGDLEISGHAFPQMASRAAEVVYGVGGNSWVASRDGWLPRRICWFPLRMTGHTVLPIGYAAEINGNICNDSGRSLMVRRM
jgi:hypothetical protein